MPTRKAADYKSNVKPIWCAGCGDYAVHNAVMRVLADLDLPNENVAVISGIGCSSRFPGFVNTYGFHGIHGRVLPLATGVKLGSPETTVIAVSGDGDGFSIGGGHIPHAARRNIDITYIVMDNAIYGMTKGQPSPTSPEGMVRKASPYGVREQPVNPILMALAYQTSFVARAFSGKLKEMLDVIRQAIEHPGFALVQVLSPCVTYYPTYDLYREITAPIPETHDASDLLSAMRLALDTQTQYLGVFYRDSGRRPFEEQMAETRSQSKHMTLDSVMERFRR